MPRQRYPKPHENPSPLEPRRCPKCSSGSMVRNRAWDIELSLIYRVRKCLSCGHKWRTYEVTARFLEQFSREVQAANAADPKRGAWKRT